MKIQLRHIFISSLLVLFSCNDNNSITPAPDAGSKGVSTEEENSQLIRYFFEEVYNKGNVDVADSIVDTNYRSHNKLNIDVMGPAGIKKAALAQRSAFSNWKSILDDVIARDNKVVKPLRSLAPYS